MKKFIGNILKFLLIPIFIFLVVEIYLGSYPLTFKKQASYFKDNLDNIDLLIMGSSHNHDAINPEFITANKAASLARGSQDIELDYLMLDKYIKDIPKLRYVFFELSYHSLEHDIPNTFHLNSLYLRYFNVNNFDREPRLIDRSIFFSAPKTYIKLLNPFHDRIEVNK